MAEVPRLRIDLGENIELSRDAVQRFAARGIALRCED